MTSTSDSNCRAPPISSTDKVVPIMVPVTDTSIVASIGSSFAKLSSVDKVNLSSTTIVDPPSSSSPNLTINIDSNPSIFDIDITVSYFVNKDGSIFEMIYGLEIKSNCTIDELISYIVSLKDINVFRDRVKLVCCGTQLYNFPVTDKLPYHGIKQDLVISMTFSSIITDSFNKKRALNDNLVKDVKPDKRLKGNISNVNNDDGKDQSLHNIPKQIYVPIEKSLVTYSSVTDRNTKLSQLILDKNVSEKIDSKITLPYISSIIEGMSKVKVKLSIVDDPNILKVSFVLCYIMLIYFMLYCGVLCYVVLCYVMLCYVVVCYVMLCYVMLGCVVLLGCDILDNIALYYVILYYFVL